MSERAGTCWDLIAHGVAPTPDPDITGLGVIVAFTFSAYITLAATLVAYAAGLVDDGLLRPVDRLVLNVPSRAAKHIQIHTTLRKAILALSDTQIVTGIAILGAGFQGLRTGTISVYHYQIVVYLAWMSSSVHLSALTILRPFLYYHRGVMIWRVAGMLVLLVMLLVALIPTISNDWAVITVWPKRNETTDIATKTAMGVPARCFWGATYGDGVNADAVLSFVILLISYIWKMGALFMPVKKQFERWLRHPIESAGEKVLAATARRYNRNDHRHWLWLFRLCLAIYLPLMAVLEILGSFSAALWLSILGTVYGSLQILVTRQIMQAYYPQLAQSESQLGFGQLLPIILLVQPLGAICEDVWVVDEDESKGLYSDYGRTLSEGAAFDVYEARLRRRNAPPQILVDFMATYQTPMWSLDGPQRYDLKALLYTSRLFKLLVWLTQASVAGTACVVFWIDAINIAFSTTDGWVSILYGIVGWSLLLPPLTLLLSLFSRLGRGHARQKKQGRRMGEDGANEDVQTQMLGHDPTPVESIALSATTSKKGELHRAWSSKWHR